MFYMAMLKRIINSLNTKLKNGLGATVSEPNYQDLKTFFS